MSTLASLEVLVVLSKVSACTNLPQRAVEQNVLYTRNGRWALQGGGRIINYRVCRCNDDSSCETPDPLEAPQKWPKQGKRWGFGGKS
eukprot:3790019-Amphidinium_carterae.1